MKTFITAVLCFCLMAMTLNAGDTNSVPTGTNTTAVASTPHPTLVLEIMFSLVVIAVGVAVVIKVKGAVPNQNAVISLVLEKSYDHGTWTPVYTNANVQLQGTNMIDFFTDQMTDQNAFYRARKLK